MPKLSVNLSKACGQLSLSFLNLDLGFIALQDADFFFVRRILFPNSVCRFFRDPNRTGAVNLNLNRIQI
jgi:hypothetical protein